MVLDEFKKKIIRIEARMEDILILQDGCLLK
jgi:hypothetical protein